MLSTACLTIRFAVLDSDVRRESNVDLELVKSTEFVDL